MVTPDSHGLSEGRCCYSGCIGFAVVAVAGLVVVAAAGLAVAVGGWHLALVEHLRCLQNWCAFASIVGSG